MARLPTHNQSTDYAIVPTLAELITHQRDLRGFTYRDLEARADGVISHQRWQQLGTNIRVKEFTEPATILAMANALDADVTTVVLATAKSVGLPVEYRTADSELARSLPASARELTREQIDAIISLVRTMASGNQKKPRLKWRDLRAKPGPDGEL